MYQVTLYKSAGVENATLKYKIKDSRTLEFPEPVNKAKLIFSKSSLGHKLGKSIFMRPREYVYLKKLSHRLYAYFEQLKWLKNLNCT